MFVVGSDSAHRPIGGTSCAIEDESPWSEPHNVLSWLMATSIWPTSRKNWSEPHNVQRLVDVDKHYARIARGEHPQSLLVFLLIPAGHL